MAAPISVVIPTLNAANGLGPCLSALTSGVTAGLIHQLIISDGGSTDATEEIAEAVGADWVAGPPSRGGQLRRGADAARGAWVMFLHADCVLAPDWVAVVAAHLEQTERGRARPAVFRLAFDDPSFAASWTSGWANWRTRLLGEPYGDQGLVLPRSLYDAAGGYPDQPLMEDVAFMAALRRRAGAPVLLPATILTSADRYRRDGWWRRGARNWGCRLRYALGQSPEELAERYRRPLAQADRGERDA